MPRDISLEIIVFILVQGPYSELSRPSWKEGWLEPKFSNTGTARCEVQGSSKLEDAFTAVKIRVASPESVSHHAGSGWLMLDHAASLISFSERVFITAVSDLRHPSYAPAQPHHHLVRRFERGAIKILVSTAIGSHGQDIPDISIVIRFGAADPLEQLKQEMGRAGRDPQIFAQAHFLVEKSCFQATNADSKKKKKKKSRDVPGVGWILLWPPRGCIRVIGLCAKQHDEKDHGHVSGEGDTGVDADMSDADIKVKCAQCEGDHVANDRHCPARARYMGVLREREETGGKTRARGKGKKDAGSGWTVVASERCEASNPSLKPSKSALNNNNNNNPNHHHRFRVLVVPPASCHGRSIAADSSLAQDRPPPWTRFRPRTMPPAPDKPRQSYPPFRPRQRRAAYRAGARAQPNSSLFARSSPRSLLEQLALVTALAVVMRKFGSVRVRRVFHRTQNLNLTFGSGNC
ncbi:hypothetical protein R3P38DRAFT_2814157 [Favolaschia claudopus]|uniref:Helicase C-terminal domain-containing protein n=1 Tax=Favolaschia claudopus TaxID=2862362 RepID=A0AAV9Z3Y4_9AGAR